MCHVIRITPLLVLAMIYHAPAITDDFCAIAQLPIFRAKRRRRALHKYDPPDLHLRRPAQDAITLAPRPCATEEDRQQEEIARAKASGLQVAFGSMSVGREAGMFSFDVAADERADAGLNGASAPGGGGDADAEAAGSKTGEVPFEEEAAYRQMASADGGFLEEGCDSDSDDDLL